MVEHKEFTADIEKQVREILNPDVKKEVVEIAENEEKND